MAQSVFFSWQSDLPETRGVIRSALEKAVKNLNRGGSLEEALRTDEATAGVAGWPDVIGTILEKIENCTVFIADITPINGPTSASRLTPNPNVLLELGYALATGMGRLRIVCVVNDYYLPVGGLKELPFDVRGSRPLVFSLPPPLERGVPKGEDDPTRTEMRRLLTNSLEGALSSVLDAVEAEHASRVLDVSPHLATDGNGQFQVVFQVGTAVPFQVDYLITEPTGNVLSGIMMSPAHIDPKSTKVVRFRSEKLKPLGASNDIYVLAGSLGHLPTMGKPVPDLHRFEIRYSLVEQALVEISRKQPGPH